MKQIIVPSSTNPSTVSVKLESGDMLYVKMEYVESLHKWFLDISTDGFAVKGIVAVCNRNLLDSWRDIINFGVGVYSPSDTDPEFAGDFVENKAILTLLDESELILDAS